MPDRAAPGIPLVSVGISLLRKRGAYEGDYARDFIREELERLGVTTFGQLRRTDTRADKALEPYQRYKLVVMATDVTRGRMLRLPWDYRLLDLDPDEQLVADAVRASMSIPLYFEPVTIRHGTTGEPTTLVDGGVLSNFPIEIFDRTDSADPRWPTLGVKIIPQLPAGNADLFPGVALPRLPPIKLLEQVVATAVAGHDQTYLERPCVRRRAIQVDTAAIGLVEFDASSEKRAAVVWNGDRRSSGSCRTGTGRSTSATVAEWATQTRRSARGGRRAGPSPGYPAACRRSPARRGRRASSRPRCARA